jgi:thioredoxin-related protein
MRLFLFLAVLVSVSSIRADGGFSNLQEAMDEARSSGKQLFVQYGREACSNCQILKGYIKKKSLRLSASKYVYADVDCDDPATSSLFRKHFKVEGTTLPFVVVANAEGEQLAGRSGYGSVKDYEEMLRMASRKKK